MDDILQKAQIVADDTRTYKKTLFNSTISGSTRAYPQLVCERNPQTKEYHLLEIRYCLDQSGRSYINCTDHSNTCGLDIMLEH